MGIFYNPPLPPTASTGGTPPEPHVPIGTAGSEPPRRSIALLMVAVLASWPQDLEPRLGKPNNERTKIAPLTLTYGQQPPLVGTSVPADYELVLASWPSDLEPRFSWPNHVRQTIAPLTLPRGDPPPLVGASAIDEAIIIASWPLDLEPRLTRPNNARVSIAPLTLTYGTQPSPQPPLALAELVTIVSAWPTSWEAQSSGKNAAWNVPPLLVSLPYTPLPRLIWQAWEPPWIQPPAPVSVAPRTLVYGAQPPPAAGLSSSDIAALVASWATTWDAQTAPKNAAWNVPPILVQVPYAVLPQAIRSAWEPPWIAPPPPIRIAPLTLVYGTPPAPRPALSAATFQVLLTWAQSWDTQRAPRLVTITLPTGAQPPNRSRVDQQIATAAAWAPIFVLQPRAPVVIQFVARPSQPTEFFTVASQDRTFNVPTQGRFRTVKRRDTFAIDAQGRFVQVDDQDREFDA